MEGGGGVHFKAEDMLSWSCLISRLNPVSLHPEISSFPLVPSILPSSLSVIEMPLGRHSGCLHSLERRPVRDRADLAYGVKSDYPWRVIRPPGKPPPLRRTKWMKRSVILETKHREFPVSHLLNVRKWSPEAAA